MARLPIDFSEPEADLAAARDYANRLAPMQSDEDVAIQQLNQSNAPLEWFPAIREGVGGIKQLITGETPLASGGEIINRLVGNGQERYQTWPEQMVRSGGSLPHDVYSGELPVRDNEGRTSQQLIERTQDLSGMAGGGFAAKPNAVVAAAKSSELAPLAALERAPRFYSALENAIKNSKTKVADADQWLGELRNQPGVKAEELDWVLHDLPKGNLTKAELEQFVNEHKVELKEVDKGGGVSWTNNKNEMIRIYKELAAETSSMKDTSEAAIKAWFERELSDPNSDIRSAFAKPEQTKFSQWQLPGGENYREHLLTLPEKKLNTELPDGYHVDAYSVNGQTKYGVYGPDGHRYGSGDTKELALERYAKLHTPLTNFQSSHWSEPNVLAHIRTNERVIPPSSDVIPITAKAKQFANDNSKSNIALTFLIDEMKKQGLKEGVDFKVSQYGSANSLHVEEIQSDWHQKGRKEGYKGEKEELQPKFDKIEQKILDSNDESIMANPELKDALKTAVDKGIITADEAKTYARYTAIESGSPVPDAPFKSNWADLALKRIIRQAAEEGKDSISWTPGEAQALRYQNEIRQKLNAVEWHNMKGGKVEPSGKKQILVSPSSGNEIELTVNKNGNIVGGHRELKGKSLESVLGKDIASKILDKAEGNIDAKGYVMNSEPMKAFYDKMLVDKANAIAKKFGGKVEQAEIDKSKGKPTQYADYEAWKNAPDNEKQSIHVLRITPQLRDAALNKGFSLFADIGKVGAPLAALTRVEHNPFKLGELEKQHGVKLTPVDENPFTTDAYHGGPRPFKGTDIIDYTAAPNGDKWTLLDKRGRRTGVADFDKKEQAENYIRAKGVEFYSAKNPELSGEYAHEDMGRGSPSIMPLKLNTRDYHVVDAKGKSWTEVNWNAINEANQLRKKGVTIHNVRDANPAFDVKHGPQTINITLDANTVRSKNAKFDPAKFHESGLLKASGIPIYSDDKGNQLMPSPPNPARIPALEPDPHMASVGAAKAAEWLAFLGSRNYPKINGPLTAAWIAQWPMMGRMLKDDIQKQLKAGKKPSEIEFDKGSIGDIFGVISSLREKYGAKAHKLQPVAGNPFQ